MYNVELWNYLKNIDEFEYANFCKQCFEIFIGDDFPKRKKISAVIVRHKVNGIELSNQEIVNHFEVYVDKYATEHELELYYNQEQNKIFETKNKFKSRYCFQCCEIVNWDKDKIQETASFLNCSPVTVLTHGRDYALNFLGIDYGKFRDEAQKRGYLKKMINSKHGTFIYNDVLEFISTENDSQKIINIIESSDIDFTILKRRVFDYVMVHGQGNKEQLMDELNQKIAVYTKYNNKKKEEEKMEKMKKIEDQEKLVLLDAQIIVKKFINGDTTNIKAFCYYNEISREVFDMSVMLVKKYDEKLYNLYLSVIQNKRSTRYAMVLSKLKNMAQLINTGILNEKGEKIRDFDILDYYMKSNISPEELKQNFGDALSVAERKTIFAFFSANTPKNDSWAYTLNCIMSTKQEINCEIDNKGFPIPGTGHVVSKREKYELIEFLERNQLPLNDKTYAAAYKRFRNGCFKFIIEEPAKTLTK